MTKRCKADCEHNNRLRTPKDVSSKKKEASRDPLSTPLKFETNLSQLEHCYADSKSKQYSCDTCRKDISTQAKIRCAVCDELYLCLGCFSLGAETKSHKYWHDYRIVEYLHVPLFCRQWGADEEILLLEGLEMYGMGNWADIASHICSKDQYECKEHYFKYYLNASVPIENLFDNISFDKNRVEYLNSAEFQKENHPLQVAVPPAPKTIHKTHPAYKKADHLSGYLPARDEFVFEWDMSCEDGICELEFESDDSLQELEMKMSLLEIYNSRLEKRRQIKKFVVDHKLHNFKYQSKKNLGRTRKHRELHDRMKKFMQIMSNEEYEEFISDVVLEKELEKRVNELQEYRSAGITTFEEAAIHKSDKKAKKEGIIKEVSLSSSNEFSNSEQYSMSPSSRAATRLHQKQLKQQQLQKAEKQLSKQLQQEQRMLRQQQRQQYMADEPTQESLHQFYFTDQEQSIVFEQQEQKISQSKQFQQIQQQQEQELHLKLQAQNQQEQMEIIQECKNITRASSRLLAKKQQQQQIQQQKKLQQQRQRELRDQKHREQEEQELEMPFSFVEYQIQLEQQVKREQEEIYQHQLREQEQREREQRDLERRQLEEKRLLEEKIQELRELELKKERELAEQREQELNIEKLMNSPQKRITPTKVMNRRQMQKQKQRRPLVIQQRQIIQHEQTIQRQHQKQRQRQHQQSREQRLSPEAKGTRGGVIETFFCLTDLVSLY